MSIAFRYVLFAILSSLINFGVQELVVTGLPWAPLMLSILAGTAAGFAAKYVLDKNWIFFDSSSSHGEEARKVGLYGLFSVFTTIVFWSFEIAAWSIWQTDVAKYSGGALGLAIGYVAKYWLDRRFVFRTEAS
ncbi:MULTISPECIES: GtrA family protein [unclassified Devosia]|uniref:GtrA family protein n=1 Tax=unclassified Devosia TaxID=196773 RepID=UPI00155624BB|nr:MULTISPECIES: GtrA family protein [unclassified Devosia]